MSIGRGVPRCSEDEIMKKLLVVMVLAGFALGLAGCETVKGVGRDMEKAGEAIQKSAD